MKKKYINGNLVTLTGTVNINHDNAGRVTLKSVSKCLEKYATAAHFKVKVMSS